MNDPMPLIIGICVVAFLMLVGFLANKGMTESHVMKMACIERNMQVVSGNCVVGVDKP